jgi:cytochrome c biogenesis protein CcmG/thiol:disulfide interchange protein DsbE
MNKRIIFLLPLVIAIVMGIVFYNSIGKDPTLLQSALLNKPLPAFKLPTVKDEKKIITEQDIRGKVVLINVWATWCPTCRAEHGFLLKLKRDGVPIIGIDYKDERDAALKWLKGLGDPYQYVIFDKEGTLGFNMGVYGAPETYVIDKQGVIRHRQVGEVNEQVWTKTIKPLMDKLNKES